MLFPETRKYLIALFETTIERASNIARTFAKEAKQVYDEARADYEKKKAEREDS